MTDKLRRVDFGKLLKDTTSVENVYFQPPPDIDLKYPCLVYERDDEYRLRADNKLYHWQQRYQVTYIDREPDSEVLSLLRDLETCSFETHFATSGLNHDVFVIYH